MKNVRESRWEMRKQAREYEETEPDREMRTSDTSRVVSSWTPVRESVAWHLVTITYQVQLIS